MKRFGLLLIVMVVSLSLSACISDEEPAFSGVEEDAQYVAEEAGTGQSTRMIASLDSALAIENAMSNFEAEFMERIETTPLQVFPLLVSALEHGTTNINFAYSDRWTGDVSLNASFLSDIENVDFALRGDVEFQGMNVDFSTYLNEERLAVSSSYLGGEYYGVVFATLVDDVTRIAGEVGLDVSEFEEVLTAFSVFEEYMNIIETLENYGMEDALLQLIFDFMRNGEQEPEEVDGTLKIAYTFTMSDFIGFMNDYMNLVMVDEVFAFYDNPLFSDTLGISGEEMRSVYNNEMQYMFRELEQMADGELTMAFYIGQLDRLQKIEMYGTVEAEGQEFDFKVAFDLGENATDTWKLTAEATDGWNMYSFTMAWDISVNGGRNVHDFNMTMNGIGLAAFTSDWNPSNGELILSVVTGVFERQTQELLRANLTLSDETFRFRFAHEDSFSIDISTERGANISNVNFVNIGELSFAELESLATNIMGYLDLSSIIATP
ncbi:MAG: hypothetical protein FWE27_07015 [Defluviitaleaceae bacterium]|nr:hypothetical protein [Defluviitaleaceae bacterium]